MNGSNISENTVEEQLLKELISLKKGEGRSIAIIGTRNLSLTHSQIIELLAYGLINDKSQIITSGGQGTNEAIIKGVKKQPSQLENLIVILPQTIHQQPSPVKHLLKGLNVVIEHPEREDMPLAEASFMCNKEIVDKSHQLLAFLYHDSHTLMDTVKYARSKGKPTTIFYLD